MEWIKRLICRWKYSRLSDEDKKLFAALKLDPDSLIADGKLK